MVKLIRKKLKGSTLIEVLIAMVIIVVIFTIAMQVFSNVMQTGVSFRNIKVQNQMMAIAQEVRETGVVPQETLVIDSIAYELKIGAKGAAGLPQLEISATQAGQKLGELKCLINQQQHEEN